jgi:mono/diheme cytochrome c family protein
VVLARAGERTLALAADEDGKVLHSFDVEAREPLAVTPLDGTPSHLLVLSDGRVAVALRDANRVAIYEPPESPTEPLTFLCSRAVAAEPVALAEAPNRLLVASGWGRTLTSLRTLDLEPEVILPLGREPRAVITDERGERVFVSHAVGARLSFIDLTKAEPKAIAIDLRLGDNREGAQGFAIVRSPPQSAGESELAPGTAARIFVPMVSVDPGAGEHSMATYGPFNGMPVAPVVLVIDEATQQPISKKTSLELDERNPLGTLGGPGRVCSLPRAAALHGGRSLLVSCLGIDAVLELDARARDPIHVERRRFQVPAGPTGLAVDERGQRAVVWSQFAHELSILDLTRAGRVVTLRPRAALASWPAPVIARGRALFHESDDPRISADSRACASCHPDGRDDGLSWQTPDGKHQTIMLAGRIAGAEPFGWFAEGPSLRAHVRKTLRRLGGRGIFSGADAADFEALLAYLGAMRGPSIEGAAGGPPADRIARGRELFESPAQGCATCHPGGGTDQARHDVKSGPFKGAAFDTPSLRFVGGTGPYFHDGRFETLEELLRKSDGAMGHTKGLSSDDIQALVAYLETR